MFAEVFRFELGYQLRRKSTWFYLVAVSALLLQLTYEAFFDQAREGSYFFNSPHVIASAALIGSWFGMLVTAAVAGDAASRDDYTRMASLLYTTPIDKAAYLGGRFLASFTVVAGLFLTVPLVQWLSLLRPGLDPALIGPFRLEAYALSYLVLLLPTLFVTCALMFSAALLARRAMAGFLVGAVLFLWTLFSNAIFAQTKGWWALARLLDPFAFTAMMEISRSRTGLQKGQLLVGLEPSMLANRGLWLAIALVVLAYAWSRFAFSHELHAGWRWLRPRRPRAVTDPMSFDEGEAARDHSAVVPLPPTRPRFDLGARLRQVLSITAASFREIATSRGVIAVLAVVVIVGFAARLELMEHMGVPLVPVTGFIASGLSGAQDFFGFVAPLMCVFYAGELVWRERDAGLGAIVDATPLPDWVPMLGKGLGLALALAAWQALLMGAGIYTQLSMGHTELEPLLWLKIMFGLNLSGHLLFAVLAIALHVLVDQKIVGNVAGLAAFAVTLVGSAFGLEHHLLVFGSGPAWEYSDMRGFGLTLGPLLWFKFYWAGWALLLAVLARLLWVRGPKPRLAERLALARERLSRPVLATAALALAVIAGAGGFIFHNTNVRNDFTTAKQRDARRVEYERRYARYAEFPQPRLTAVAMDIELYPEQGRATVQARQLFVNHTPAPIDTLHVETAAVVDTGPLRFDRPVTLLADDTDYRHRIVRLREPLQPGEALAMASELRFGERGFDNGGLGQEIAPKASHFEQDWLPVLGYQRSRELNDEVARREHGLPARPEVRPLSDLAARHDLRGNERISVDTTIGTAADQTAVGPGILQRSWTCGGRRYFHYTTQVPIRTDFGIYSADYAVHTARWRDVAIRLYHHPRHAANMPRLAKAVQASLERYSREFGPYPSTQLTVVEAPRYALGARSHSTSIRIFEGYALMNPDADPRKLDFAYAVMAHEIAHQWWGNQAAPAAVAGAPFVAESLAWYSAFGVVEEAKGKAELERLLDVMRDAYLEPRSRDGVPLLQTADWFRGYRMGPFAMFALREEVGDEAVNLALRRFLGKFGQGHTPLPTSLDLYAELKAVTPAAQHAFLADLFERSTYWNLRTTSAAAEKVDGGWRVTLEVSVAKASIDTQGRETPRPLTEAIEIGVFGPPPAEAATAAAGRGEILYLAKHRLRPGVQRISVIVPRPPASAGIDPRFVLIDTVRHDNTVSVSGVPQ